METGSEINYDTGEGTRFEIMFQIMHFSETMAVRILPQLVDELLPIACKNYDVQQVLADCPEEFLNNVIESTFPLAIKKEPGEYKRLCGVLNVVLVHNKIHKRMPIVSASYCRLLNIGISHKSKTVRDVAVKSILLMMAMLAMEYRVAHDANYAKTQLAEFKKHIDWKSALPSIKNKTLEYGLSLSMERYSGWRWTTPEERLESFKNITEIFRQA